MAKRVGQKIKMTSIDELLCVPSVAGCDEIEVATRMFWSTCWKMIARLNRNLSRLWN